MDGHKRILWIVGGGGNGLEGEGGEGGQNYFLRKSTSNSTNSKLKVMNGVNNKEPNQWWGVSSRRSRQSVSQKKGRWIAKASNEIASYHEGS